MTSFVELDEKREGGPHIQRIRRRFPDDILQCSHGAVHQLPFYPDVLRQHHATAKGYAKNRVEVPCRLRLGVVSVMSVANGIYGKHRSFQLAKMLVVEGLDTCLSEL